MSLNFTYLPRTIETVINRASQRYKGVMVTGMRQVGKSTMLRRMQGDRRYVNLDRYQALDLARQAPDAFFKQYPMPLLIDEFQRAPDLGLEIKAILDETDERGLVWLTGSQKLGLRKAVAEALSGRVASFELFPFSLYELQGKGPEQKPFMPTGELTRGSLDPLTAEELWKIIWQGSWPEVVHDEPDQRDAFFDSLLRTYIEKDILSTGVRRVEDFERFLSVLASRIGQEFAIGEIQKPSALRRKLPAIGLTLPSLQALSISCLLSTKTSAKHSSRKASFTSPTPAWLPGCASLQVHRL